MQPPSEVTQTTPRDWQLPDGMWECMGAFLNLFSFFPGQEPRKIKVSQGTCKLLTTIK